MEEYPTVAYVALSRLALTELRTRQQVQTVLRGIGARRRFLVVDFEGVRSISQAACHELLVKVRWYGGMFVEPINLEPGVARTLWSIVRRGW